MRNRLKYLNSLEHLSVSNSKEEVFFYIFNYSIGNRCLTRFIPKEGLTIKKAGVDIKSELDRIIQQVESHFQLTYADFLQLEEVLGRFKEHNIKCKVVVEDDEIVVFFNRIKVHEPDKLKNLAGYFYKNDDTLFQGYVNSDKFYLHPMWKKKKEATIKDYIDFFEKALSVGVSTKPSWPY